MTVVDSAVGVPKVTKAEGSTAVHLNVSVPPTGRPSSSTVPVSVVEFVGSVRAWLGPASTEGGWFGVGWMTVTVTWLVTVKSPSLPVRRRT